MKIDAKGLCIIGERLLDGHIFLTEGKVYDLFLDLKDDDLLTVLKDDDGETIIGICKSRFKLMIIDYMLSTIFDKE